MLFRLRVKRRILDERVEDGLRRFRLSTLVLRDDIWRPEGVFDDLVENIKEKSDPPTIADTLVNDRCFPLGGRTTRGSSNTRSGV